VSSTRQPVRFDLSARGARRALLLILGASFALYATAIGWGLPGLRGWAPDEIEPQVVLAGAEAGFAGEWTRRYPPLHYRLLAGLYGPVGLTAERLGLDRQESHQWLFLAGRWLSVLLATATIWLVYRIARQFHDRFVSCLAAVGAALIAPLAYYAKTVNLEVPYLFWFALSLLFYVRILRHHRLADYLAFAVAAACSVGSKDQAFALYGLPLLLLPMFLCLHRRTVEGRTGGAWRAFLDRRLLWAAVAGTVAFASIHKLPFDLEGFRRHIEQMLSISGPAAEFDASWSGHLSLAATGLRFAVFDLGLPLSAAAIGGAALALGRQRWTELSLLLFGVSYHLLFIALIRYSYDRFYLPVALVWAIFAASGLAWLLRRPRLPAALAWIVLIAVVGHAGLRAATVDAMMLADSRYAAERWLARNLGPAESALAVGRTAKLHPRNLERLEWNHRTFVSFSDWLSQSDAKFFVLHGEERWARPELGIAERLRLGEFNHAPAATIRGAPALDLLPLAGIRSNLTKLNAEILIARRLRPWGRSLEEVVAAATAALDSGDPEQIAGMADEIATTAIPDRRRLVGELVIGLAGERRWPIRVGAPAAVVVTNPGDVEWTVELQLKLLSARPGVRAPVAVRSSGRRLELTVGQGPPTLARLGPVPPGGRELFLLSATGDEAVIVREPPLQAVASGVWAAGATPDLWSSGGAPMAVLVDNPTGSPRSLEVALSAPPGRDRPLTIRAFGSGGSVSWSVAPRSRPRVELPSAPPWSRSAILLTAGDLKESSPNRRGLGFRIVPTVTRGG
jgi:hypothetical protein